MEKCEVCAREGKSSPVEMYCEDCHEDLCVTCINKHNQNPDFVIHRIHKIDSIRGCEFSAVAVAHKRIDFKGPIIKAATNHRNEDFKGPITQPEPARFKCCGKIKVDRTYVYISGLTVTDDNRIILCNTKSNDLHVYSESGDHVQDVTLFGEPWDIAIIPGGKKAVVTLSNVPAVQFIELTPIKSGKLLPIPKKCYGVAVINNCLYLGGRGIIYVVNNCGQVLSTIKASHDGHIWYIHPGPHNTLYHTSYDFNQVFCIGLVDGFQHFMYESTSKEMKENLELDKSSKYNNHEKSSVKPLKRVYEEETLGGPEAIATDANGNLYIACRESSSICRLSPKLEFKGLVFTKHEGIRKPYAIAFFKDFTKLVVSNNDGEIVTISHVNI